MPRPTEERSSCGALGTDALPSTSAIFVFAGEGAHSETTDWRELRLAPAWADVDEAIKSLSIADGLEPLLLQHLGCHAAPLSPVVTTAINILNASRWRAAGHAPSVAIGHSIGEVAAAEAAGLLSTRSAIELAFTLGRVAATLEGGMLHTVLARAQVDAWSDPELCVSAINDSGVDPRAAVSSIGEGGETARGPPGAVYVQAAGGSEAEGGGGEGAGSASQSASHEPSKKAIYQKIAERLQGKARSPSKAARADGGADAPPTAAIAPTLASPGVPLPNPRPSLRRNARRDAQYARTFLHPWPQVQRESRQQLAVGGCRRRASHSGSSSRRRGRG